MSCAQNFKNSQNYEHKSKSSKTSICNEFQSNALWNALLSFKNSHLSLDSQHIVNAEQYHIDPCIQDSTNTHEYCLV